MMEEGKIKEKIEMAKRITEGLPEPHRSISFGVVLGAGLLSEVLSLAELPAKKPVEKVITLTLSEYLSQLEPKDFLTTTTAIINYEFKRGIPALTCSEIIDKFKEARRTLPKNLSDVLSRCIKKGWLSETEKEGKKAYQIIVAGEKYVGEQLKPPQQKEK